MSGALDFGYAQARIQARYAALPPETEWHRLAATRSLGAYLEEARVGPLGPWLKGFSALSDAHDMERGIRALAWEQTQEAASWTPRTWRPAIRWVAWLPYLGVFEELARTRRFPPWAQQDPRLRDCLDDKGTTSAEALQRHGLTPLTAHGNPEQLASGWMREWKDRWPAMPRQQASHLMAFLQELGTHLRAFRQGGPDTAWELRHQLRDRLRLRLHQRLLEPLAVFLYLALVFLDLERLRGELVGRCLFSPGTAGADQHGGAI
jgi:hypothetical protein